MYFAKCRWMQVPPQWLTLLGRTARSLRGPFCELRCYSPRKLHRFSIYFLRVRSREAMRTVCDGQLTHPG